MSGSVRFGSILLVQFGSIGSALTGLIFLVWFICLCGLIHIKLRFIDLFGLILSLLTYCALSGSVCFWPVRFVRFDFYWFD